MTDTHRRGLPILVGALLAGIAADYLMRSGPGLNIPLWVGLVVAIIVLLGRYGVLTLTKEDRWLAIPVLFLASAFAWRNSELLLMVDGLVLVATIALATMLAGTGSLRLRSIADYGLNTAAGAVNILTGPFRLLLGDITWQTVPRAGWPKTGLAVARGLLIAIPLLLIFGGLFISADPVYEHLITETLAFDLDTVFDHIILVLFYAWLTAGILRTTAWGSEGDWSQLDDTFAFLSLGRVEMATILGSLKALFLSFVAIQFRYLFGGRALIDATLSLTYAEYARQGFFELVAVAALLLPLLLIIHWLLRHEDGSGQRLFRWLSGGLVALLYLVMASAFYRMRLYQQEFGQTELRLFVTVFMVWLAFIFAWFVVTVLRNHRERFIAGVLVTGYLTLAILHIVNPDAYIARSNLLHFRETGRYDLQYNHSLSADAVPVLIEIIPELPTDKGQTLADHLLLRWGNSEAAAATLDNVSDWRGWNWGQHKALQAVEENLKMLERVASGRKAP